MTPQIPPGFLPGGILDLGACHDLARLETLSGTGPTARRDEFRLAGGAWPASNTPSSYF